MALKVFDLECEAGHVFEGWFASHQDYDSQREGGLLRCPLCDSARVERRVSAPRLNVSAAAREPAASQPSPASGGNPELSRMQAEALRELRAALRAMENVGERFADEARRIHEGDAPARAIRGIASAAEREALVQDGIAVMPVPAFLDDDRLQ